MLCGRDVDQTTLCGRDAFIYLPFHLCETRTLGLSAVADLGGGRGGIATPKILKDSILFFLIDLKRMASVFTKGETTLLLL